MVTSRRSGGDQNEARNDAPADCAYLQAGSPRLSSCAAGGAAQQIGGLMARISSAELTVASDTLLVVRMLGPMEVTIDGWSLDDLPGRIGVNILRMLLLQPGYASPRDVLLEAFWPGCDPAVAKNRLQVAVSGLRRAFRQATDDEVIEYSDDRYRIARGVTVDLDVEDFRLCLARARDAAQSENREAAIRFLEEAIRIYRGDLAPDAAYDEWALLPRERLLMEFVDALDRLCGWLEEEDDTYRLIPVAHRIIEIDPCREDIHRLLMTAYAGDGRTHQVARQYEFCVRALRAALGVTPSRETVALYRGLRVRLN